LDFFRSCCVFVEILDDLFVEIVWYLQLIRFFLSNDVTVCGLRIENSPQFHLRFDDCERVRVDGLFVSSPASSPNTDGVHVENTTSVQILNSSSGGRR
jgi:polygalacturonase